MLFKKTFILNLSKIFILFFPLFLTTPLIAPEKKLLQPSLIFFLGTNSFGQSLLPLLLKSIAFSSLLSFISVVGVLLFTFFLIYLSLWFKKLTNFLFQTSLLVPNQIFNLLLLVFFKPSVLNFIIIFIFSSWTSLYKIMLPEFELIQKKPFYLNGVILGASSLRLFIFYFLPQLQNLLKMQFVFLFMASIIQQSALGFLGLSPGNYPSLGMIINEGRSVFLFAPWILFSSLGSFLFLVYYSKRIFL